MPSGDTVKSPPSVSPNFSVSSGNSIFILPPFTVVVKEICPASIARSPAAPLNVSIKVSPSKILPFGEDIIKRKVFIIHLFLGFCYCFVYSSDKQERGLGQIVVFAVYYFFKSADSFCKRYVSSFNSRKFFRYVERL